MRQRGDDARGHQHLVVGRERAGQVAEREDRHQREQHGLARQLAGGDGEHRRADRDPERVARDQQAGGRDGDLKIRRDLHEQAHDDEFGGAYSEGTGGEGEKSDGHDACTVRTIGFDD
ncbi:hypothetical protein D9M69_520960 [compost metagenome]